MMNNAIHCADSNPELWSFYSDYFKEANGIRPRFFMSEDDVNQSIPRLEAQIIAEIEDERAYDASQLEEATWEDRMTVAGWNEPYAEMAALAGF